jgi:hypothetical protein
MVVTFLTAKQTHDFIDHDKDQFISNLSPTDLVARGVRSRYSYRIQCAQSADDFTCDEKSALARNAQRADELFKKLFCVPGLNPHVICQMPWNFAKCSVDYEGGLPHTRSDIIFTKSGELTVDQCAHEKIHVYQRLYPEAARVYLTTRGFAKIAPDPMRRANPDQDNNSYSRRGKVYDGIYTSRNPSSISSVRAAQHPYELMAYEAVRKLNLVRK